MNNFWIKAMNKTQNMFCLSIWFILGIVLIFGGFHFISTILNPLIGFFPTIIINVLIGIFFGWMLGQMIGCFVWYEIKKEK